MSNSTFKCTLSPGTKIGDYIVDAYVGSGAYGEVYRVHDALEKNFALKLLFSREDKEANREIKGLSELRNTIRADEGLPVIYHVGMYLDRFYYTMDMADNVSAYPNIYGPDTLENRLQMRGHLSGKECVLLAKNLLKSIDALHRHSLVHRDIKPGNIIFLNGKPMLADLGLITSSPRTIVGTIGFLPPIPSGGPTLETEKRADLYSLGKVLYCAFTGEPVERYPLLPSEYSLKDFAVVRSLYQTACSDDPAKRFQNCGEFLKAVEAAENKLASSDRDSGKTGKAVFTAVIVLLLTIIAGVLLLKGVKTSPNPTDPVRKTATSASVHKTAGEEALLKIDLNNGVYQILCCFSCVKLEDQDPHARTNQFMAASFVKTGLSKELRIPEGKKLKVRHGKYLVQPFRKGDLLVYMYQIAASDCLIVDETH